MGLISRVSSRTYRFCQLLPRNSSNFFFPQKMAAQFGAKPDLNKLNDFLLDKSYIAGWDVSSEDVAVFKAISAAPNAELVNALRWWNHIKSYQSEFGSIGAAKVAAAAAAESEEEDDDDRDFFPSDDEEDAAAEPSRPNESPSTTSEKPKRPRKRASSQPSP